jgi:hypothetical protein
MRNQYKRSKLFVLICFLSSTVCLGQANIEEEVLTSIIHSYLVAKGELGFYIKCDKRRTFFDADNFLQNVNKNVPIDILEQLEAASIKDTSNKSWNVQIFNNLRLTQDLLKLTKCITEQEAEEIFKQTKKRQRFYSVSQPIFDKSKQHCVLQLSVLNWLGSASGESLFLRKIYGKWIVIESYDVWIT